MKLGLPAIMFFAAAVLVGEQASASDATIALGEVSPPPASFGDVRSLHAAAEGAIRQLDPSHLRRRQRIVVSVALTRTAVDPVDCTASAMVRDARTGTMLVIVQAGAHAEGPISSDLRKQVASAAVRNAIRLIPSALVRQ